MLKRHVMVVGSALCVTGILAAPSWATVQNLKSYKAANPGQEPKAYTCKTCHGNAVGKQGDLNAYGLALQKHKGAGNAKALTVEDYQAVEQPAATPSSSTTTPAKTP